MENAITEGEGAHLRDLLQRTHRELEERGSYSPEMDIREGVFSRNTDLQTDPVVMSLLTQEKVFPKMVDIMGANIYNWHNFTPCTRRAPDGTVMPTLDEMQTTVPRYGFHRDGGFENFFKERPTPRMTAKFIYFLTDMSEPGRGNTWIVPGSHKRGGVTVDVPEVGNLGAAEGQPDGAIPVCCPPNSCLLFDRRLLHCGTPNYSTEHERLLFIIGFGYRWLRARDGLYVEPAMERATCPVVKQLLGATSSSAGLFRPASADCPLAYFLAKHQLGPPGGLGRDHQHEPRWRNDGLGVPSDPAVCLRIADGDVGGHATYPRHPWRAGCDVEPPAAPLVGGRSLIDRNELATLDNPHVARTQTEAEIVAAVEMTPEQWQTNHITPEEQAKFETDGYCELQF